jgi:cyclic-di-GMP-binding biofilm dispersal mediator protein
MSDLTGKTVLVMGGDRGIGRAVVRAFAESGAHVLIHSSGDEATADDALAEEIGAGSSGA